MPRAPRFLSQSGYYHFIVRGNGQQILFEENDDFETYLRLLKKYCPETGITLFSYCLMNNHVHLLLTDPLEHISLFAKKTGVCYAQYYNNKYDHTGHVFQGRFLSEPVENEQYFCIAYRYILKNPEKAGICSAREYPWSSYSLHGTSNSFVDTIAVADLLGTGDDFSAFMSLGNDDECLEYDSPPHNDDWAMEIIKRSFSVKSSKDISLFKPAKRNEAILLLKKKGLSIRQISRLTGLTRGTIGRQLELSKK